jgi:hypothetical protein
MDTESMSPVQSAREAQFLEGIRAFMYRDFATLTDSMRPDVAMDFPGSSWLAGSHEGFDEVSRCIIGLRQVLGSEEGHISFLHESDQMIVRHDVGVHGPEHDVNMALRVRIRYDDEGRARSISVEPDDLPLFDYVLNTMMHQQLMG